MTAQPEGEKAMYDGISDAVARLAEKIDADVIVCQTASGTTALTMAAQRPNVPIISVTPNPRVANQLALIYANSAFVRKYDEHFGRDLALELKDSGYLQTKPGKKDLLAVIVSGDKNKFGTDTIKIRHI
jgi:pyruvate kinase